MAAIKYTVKEPKGQKVSPSELKLMGNAQQLPLKKTLY